MKKEDLANLVTEYGDAVITYRSEKCKKLKYNVCTLDFDNSKELFCGLVEILSLAESKAVIEEQFSDLIQDLYK